MGGKGRRERGGKEKEEKTRESERLGVKKYGAISPTTFFQITYHRRTSSPPSSRGQRLVALICTVGGGGGSWNRSWFDLLLCPVRHKKKAPKYRSKRE